MKISKPVEKNSIFHVFYFPVKFNRPTCSKIFSSFHDLIWDLTNWIYRWWFVWNTKSKINMSRNEENKKQYSKSRFQFFKFYQKNIKCYILCLLRHQCLVKEKHSKWWKPSLKSIVYRCLEAAEQKFWNGYRPSAMWIKIKTKQKLRVPGVLLIRASSLYIV